MALLALIIALLIERYFHRNEAARSDSVSYSSWFERYLKTMDSSFSGQSWYRNWVGQAFLLLGPAILLYWIYSWLQHDWWDHGNFLASVVVLALTVWLLVVSLGPESPKKSLAAYYKARAEHDDDAAYSAAAVFLKKASVEDVETDHSSNNVIKLDAAIAREVFKKTQTRYFGVVIWFILLGPAAALLYRFTSWYQENAEDQQMKQKLETASEKAVGDVENVATESEHSDNRSALEQGFAYKLGLILEWIPSRITAIAYLLAGDMGNGVRKTKKDFLSFDKDGLEYVQDVGEASLGFYEQDDSRGPSRWALKLVERAAIIILALVAIFSLLGFGMH